MPYSLPMAKSTDYPPQIREFGKEIQSFSHRYYDYDIFSDFIDFSVGCLLLKGDPPLADRLKEKYRDEYHKFEKLFLSMVQCVHRNLSIDRDWYDVLGTAYEVIAANSKRSGMGQFFTPKSVCDFMAKIQAPDEAPSTMWVNDPACGSGRTLLAFYCLVPNSYLCADDLDQICTKMAAINMAIHGCRGQACNTNSLSPDDWKFGYEVNPYLLTFSGVPHLQPIQKEQSYTWSMWETRRIRNEKPPEPPPITQLTMF